MKLLLCVVASVLVLTSTTGCVGMVIGAAADAAIEVGKVPFKVGGAVVDVVNGDDEKDDKEEADQDDEVGLYVVSPN